MNKLFSSLYKKKSPYELLAYFGIIALGIAVDQMTKYLAVKYLIPLHTVPVIEDVLHLTYVENPGAAFGMLKNAPWVFNTVSIAASLGMAIYLFLGRAPNRLYSISLCLIVSGGIGNLIDRLSLGYVVDFVDFRIINFAVFNGADTFVCVGAGMLVLALILDIIKETKMTKEGKNGN